MTLAIPLTGKDPPTEFRLFRAGENKSRKGTFVFDEEAAKRVMADFELHGLDCLNFDYEHGQLRGATTEDRRSAGTFRPEVRQGPELWITKADWTKKAHEGISNKEWLYFSPAFDYDADRRITRLINCALTNLPALDDIPTLTAASHLSAVLQESFEDIQDMIRKAINARLGGRLAFLKDVYDDHFVYEIDDKYFWQNYTLDTDAVTLDGEPLEVREEYVPVLASAMASEHSGTSVQQPSADARDTPVIDGQRGRQMTALLSMAAMLGLADSAGETEVLSEVGKLQSSQRELLSLTGGASFDEAKGTILGWKASAEAYAKSSAELSEIKATAKKDAREALLKANYRKFSPAMLAEDGWVRDATYELLASFVKTSPDLIPAEEPAEPAVKPATLSSDERKIARQLGLTDEQYTESRKMYDEKGGDQ